MIILNSEQKELVKGEWNNHSLNPIELKNGDFVLPIEVLQNENYPKEIRDFLLTLPQRAVAQDEFNNESL
jgi:hypothetical protein